ncbi:DUF5304 domain-containing protein [Streptomyces sp. HNM0575]|nr:DUF5304 domain-containing protein [Streptomyces sp. HNM0575]
MSEPPEPPESAESVGSTGSARSAEPAGPVEYEAQTPPDADAWATACEEDLNAEKARRRAEQGQQYGSAAEELRRLADAVSEKVAELGRPFGGTLASAAAQSVAQQLITQAKAAVEPVVERNPQIFDHLAAAGGELLAAYRAAVQDAEGRWTAGPQDTRSTPGTGSTPGTSAPDERRGSVTYGPSAGIERIDLDKDPGEPAGSGDTDGGSGGTGGTRSTGDRGEKGDGGRSDGGEERGR